MWHPISNRRVIGIILCLSIAGSYFPQVESKPFISRLTNALRFRSTFAIQSTSTSTSTSTPVPKRLNRFQAYKPKPAGPGQPKRYIGPPTAIPPKSRNKPSTANPLLKLTVHIPPATVNYGKELDVKSGGEFTLITPMENFHYSSTGNVSLRCALIQYQMQTSYSPNLTCFYLHFLTMKKRDEGNGGLCFMVMNQDP